MRLHDRVDDERNLGNEIVQKISQRTPSDPGWPDGVGYGYCHGNLVLVVKFQLGRIDTEGCYFLATFQRQQRVEQIIDSPVWSSEAKLTVCDLLKGHSEKPVLVRIVEIPDHPEQGRQMVVRSIVRLELLNPSLCGSQDLPKPLSLDALSEQGRGVCDRELQGPVIGGTCLPAIPDRKSIDKVVEGRPETSNTIGGEKRPSIQVGFFDDVQEHTVLATVSAVLSAGAVGSTVIPFVPFTLESIQVLLRPANT